MARHNRDGHGTDQRGVDYVVSYQPDWLHQIKITRDLETGRQSTKTLFRNPLPPENNPGSKVRTRVTCKEHDIDFEVTVDDPRAIVRRIIVETELPDGRTGDRLSFSVDNRTDLKKHRR